MWWLWVVVLAALILGYLGVWSGLRLMAHRRQLQPADCGNCGSVSLSIICIVKDRAGIIEGFLRGMLAFRQTLSETEIIVIDNRSSDETAAIAERLAREHQHFHVLKMTDQPPGTFPLTCGAAFARGRAVCCVDLEKCRKPLTAVRILNRIFRGGKTTGGQDLITWISR